jgi:hypothetical protein
MHVAVALRAHIQRLSRDGIEAPAGLVDLEQVMRRHGEQRDAERVRAQWRARSAAYRARKRAAVA